MFCKRCYAKLSGEPVVAIPHTDDALHLGRPLDYATDYSYKCEKCGRRYNPNLPRTYLLRQFPSRAEIITAVILTTLFGVVAAGVVAFHQMAAMSGH